MRIPLILAVVMVLLQLATDAYLFFITWHRVKKIVWAKVQLAQAAFFLVYVIVIFCMPVKDGADGTLLRTVMWMILFYIAVYAAKIMFVLFDAMSFIPLKFKSARRRKCSRAKWLTWVGVAAAVAVFFTVMWGAFINRFRLQVKELTVVVEDLPESFDGYRIVQISDLHVGTYGNDVSFIRKLVDKVNSLNPDIILFTGDIVNQRSDELRPFVGELSRLSAPDSVYSILGNHDYGDYSHWESDRAKAENMELLKDLQREMGWKLLTNASAVVHGRANPEDSIVIIGVENWGDAPFPKYGDLNAAYPALNDSVVKILMSHNPIHWKEEIEHADSCNICLTLSGHTHAMQFKIGSFSPAAWRYPGCWIGRYDSPDGKRTLYVNIGTGTVGLPMRVGATPEITLITLRKK